MSLIERQVAERERRGVGVSTVERVRRAGMSELDVSPQGHQRIHQAPLDLLKAKGLITEEMFDAGDKLRNAAADAVVAPLNPLAVEGGGRATSSDPAIARLDDAAWSGASFRTAVGKCPGVVGDIVLAVCLGEPGLTMAEIGRALGYRDKRSAQVAAMAVLRVGLGILVRHYGRSS